MAHPFMLIASLIALSVLYLLIPAFTLVFLQYRSKRRLLCPQTGTGAEVGIARARAAASQFFGAPQLKVANCTLWPGQAGCAQRCLAHP